MKIARILTPTDFSKSSRVALAPALFLARRFDARLDLLHVVELHALGEEEATGRPPPFPDDEEIFARLREISRASDGADASSALHIEEHQRRAVAAAPEIVELADEQNSDLIVLGTHGRRGFRRFLLGSVTEEVVQKAPCSVLSIPARDPERSFKGFSRIVAPIDFSPASRTALTTARELARLNEAELHVIYVLEQPPYPPPYGPMTFPASIHASAQMKESVGQGLEELAGDVCPGVSDLTVEVLEGRAPVVIIDYAAEIGADLVVMATKGLSGFEHFLLGSVTEKVVRTAPCPVWTIKAPTEEE